MSKIIDEHQAINALAREFYRMHGYEVKEGFDFYESLHPQEFLMYQMAQAAFEFNWDHYERKQ